jgi:stage II sporulation protein D
MTVSAGNFRLFELVAGVFFVLLGGCVPVGQANEQAVRQSPDQYTIRVLLDEGITKAKLKVDTQYQLLETESVRFFDVQKTEGTIDIAVTADGIKIGEQVFKTKRLIVQPPDNEPFTINKHSYRGNLELIADGNNKTMTAINNVSIETYLAGVISAEMPSYWETEALKAQAIAARTYCLYIKNRFGDNRLWDVKTTQANQVYKGVAAETIRTVNAAESTFGMVLCSETASGDCVVFGAYYSSICGGHTENAGNVFGESCAALEGVECPYCSQVTRMSLFYWPMATFDKKEISEKLFDRYPNLKFLERIEKIEPREESVYDNNFKRIISVILTGANGKTANLRAEDMRLAIDPTGMKIQSTSCVIINLNDEIMFLAGRGFGHGVGLCQYGAREMARQGKNAQQILSFYYPHSRVKKIY